MKLNIKKIKKYHPQIKSTVFLSILTLFSVGIAFSFPKISNLNVKYMDRAENEVNDNNKTTPFSLLYNNLKVKVKETTQPTLLGLSNENLYSLEVVSTKKGIRYVVSKSDNKSFILECLKTGDMSFIDKFNKNETNKIWIPTIKVDLIQNLSDNQEISWVGIDGINLYAVYASQNDGEYELIGKAKGSKYNNKKVSNNKQYKYKIVPCLDDGTELKIDCFEKTLIFYNPPKLKSIENEEGKQKINFEKVEGVNNYIVYVNKNGKWNKIGSTDKNYIYNTNVENKTEYEYTIRGLDKDGNLVTSYNSFLSKEYIEKEEETEKEESTSNSSNNNTTPTIKEGPVNEGFLYAIDESLIDENYKGVKYELTDEERSLLENIVEGEFGGDYKGAVFIAQCLRDAITYKYTSSILALPYEMGYDGYSAGRTSSSSYTKKAVSYVFDQGGSAVQHRILVMYNPTMCSSAWHESQKLIYDYPGSWGTVRFFDMY